MRYNLAASTIFSGVGLCTGRVGFLQEGHRRVLMLCKSGHNLLLKVEKESEEEEIMCVCVYVCGGGGGYDKR